MCDDDNADNKLDEDDGSAQRAELLKRITKAAATLCEDCGDVFISTAHKCEGKKKKKNVNLHTFAIDHALTAIESKWTIVESGNSTRLVRGNSIVGGDGYKEAAVVRFSKGWASHVKVAPSKEAKEFLRIKAKGYYDTDRKLSGHKGFSFLCSGLAADGLPMFSALQVVSPSVASSTLIAFEPVAMELRLRERLVTEGKLHAYALNQAPYLTAEKKGLV